MVKPAASEEFSADSAAASAARHKALRMMNRAGWIPPSWPEVDPDEPGAVWRAWLPNLPADCVETLSWPSMPKYLSETNSLGIKWNLGCMRFFSRFLRGRGFSGKHKAETNAMATSLESICLYLLLSQELPRTALCHADVEAEGERLRTWRSEVLAPADARLREVVPKMVTREHLVACEPAFTLAMSIKQDELIDTDGNARSLASALGMFTAGSLRASASKGLDVDQLLEIHDFITRNGRCITGLSPTGKFVLRHLQRLRDRGGTMTTNTTSHELLWSEHGAVT